VFWAQDRKGNRLDLTQALQIASLTDPGLVRHHNEDCVDARAGLGLVVLADGMGGYQAGEVASGMATTQISEGLGMAWTLARPEKLSRQQSKALAEKLMREQIAKANEAVYTMAQGKPECAGMGTTLVVGLFHDNMLTVAHIGDSRMYRLRGEELSQVTKDHSLLQEQIDSGLLSQEEARFSQNRNLVTRALGIDPAVEPDVATHEVSPGDIFLLCSDGLNDMIDDEEIRLTLVTLSANPKLAVRQLVQAANDSGGRDNTSVIFVRIIKDFAAQRGWRARLLSRFGK
jgi:PPM family protein phosphatase